MLENKLNDDMNNQKTKQEHDEIVRGSQLVETEPVDFCQTSPNELAT